MNAWQREEESSRSQVRCIERISRSLHVLCLYSGRHVLCSISIQAGSQLPVVLLRCVCSLLGKPEPTCSAWPNWTSEPAVSVCASKHDRKYGRVEQSPHTLFQVRPLQCWRSSSWSSSSASTSLPSLARHGRQTRRRATSRPLSSTSSSAWLSWWWLFLKACPWLSLLPLPTLSRCVLCFGRLPLELRRSTRSVVTFYMFSCFLRHVHQ